MSLALAASTATSDRLPPQVHVRLRSRSASALVVATCAVAARAEGTVSA